MSSCSRRCYHGPIFVCCSPLPCRPWTAFAVVVPCLSCWALCVPRRPLIYLVSWCSCSVWQDRACRRCLSVPLVWSWFRQMAVGFDTACCRLSYSLWCVVGCVPRCCPLLRHLLLLIPLYLLPFFLLFFSSSLSPLSFSCSAVPPAPFAWACALLLCCPAALCHQPCR
jgi:hypothetical protein